MSSGYVSITGLKLNHWWHWPRFTWHSVRSFMQAKKAEGNIAVDTRKMDGMYCTISLWETERAMRRYLYQGAHGKAARDFDNFATGKTYGYEADFLPTWNEAMQLLEERGC